MINPGKIIKKIVKNLFQRMILRSDVLSAKEFPGDENKIR